MKILYLVLNDPDSFSNGTTIRTHFLYQALKRLGTVYTAIPVMESSLEHIDENRHIQWIHLERRYSLSWLLNRLSIKLLPQVDWPIDIGTLKQRVFPSILFDVVVVRYAQKAARYAAWLFGPLFIDVDDDPVESYETMLGCHRNSIRRYVDRQILRRWRQWILDKAAGVWVTNGEQAKNISAVALPNLPLEVDKGFAFQGRQQSIMMSVGYLGHRPNVEGVDRFIKEYWPAIHHAFPELRYRIIGDDCPERFCKAWKRLPNIELCGFVSELEPFYEECLATVAPVFSGSGTCIKVQESLKHGRICIASDFALRGWPREQCTLENGIVQLGTVKELIQIIKTEPWKRPELSQRLPKFVDSLFSFEQFAKIVESVIRSSIHATNV